jgi:hypothetical protein
LSTGWRFYIVFAICGFSNALFFWAFLPETRGIPLEELDTYFESVPIFVPGSKAATGYSQSQREEELKSGKVVVAGDVLRTDQEKAEVEYV